MTRGRNGHLLYPRLAFQLRMLIGCPWMLACIWVLARVKARSKPPDFFALPFPFDFTSSTTIIATTRTYSHSALADCTSFTRKSTSYHTPLTISLPRYRITAIPHTRTSSSSKPCSDQRQHKLTIAQSMFFARMSYSSRLVYQNVLWNP